MRISNIKAFIMGMMSVKLVKIKNFYLLFQLLSSVHFIFFFASHFFVFFLFIFAKS